MESFYGKYRGKVEENNDPKQQGRLKVSVPAVYGEGTSNWAMPCVGYAGSGVGSFTLPPTGTNVWVEFEGGNPDHPIWTGFFWGEGEMPASPAKPDTKLLQTDGVMVEINESQGGGSMTIEVGPPVVSTTQTIEFGSSGITLEHGNAKVVLSSTSVSINDGALEVI